MSITLTLSPATEALLQAKATREGQPAETILAALVESQLAAEARDFDEAVAGIQQGLADVQAGREIDLEEYVAGLNARRAA